MERYKDPEWMREQYQTGTTQEDLAEMCGVAKSTICRWRQRHGIEVPRIIHKPHATFTHTGGNYQDEPIERYNLLYEVSRHGDEMVLIHRLCAVAWYGWDAMDGMHTHHENSIPWDNREANIRPISPEDHGKEHYEEKLLAD